MKHIDLFVNLIVFSCVLLLSACATTYIKPIDPTNYRSKLCINRPNISFYSAEYIGPAASVCFPPITNFICKPDSSGKPIYRETGELQMEEFHITLTSPGAPDFKFMDDMVFLTAADLAKQRGYPFMTRLNSIDSTSCKSLYSTSTYGTVNSDIGIYSGKTYLNEDVICITLRGGDFIFLKNQDALANGVFYRHNTRYFKMDILQPYKKLYYGTTPNVLFDDVTIIRDSYGFNTIGAARAWKIIYDTDSLARDLREKYRIIGNEPYTFKDERTEIEEAAKDPVERNKLSP